jgi:hypothetical protein
MGGQKLAKIDRLSAEVGLTKMIEMELRFIFSFMLVKIESYLTSILSFPCKRESRPKDKIMDSCFRRNDK